MPQEDTDTILEDDVTTGDPTDDPTKPSDDEPTLEPAPEPEGSDEPDPVTVRDFLKQQGVDVDENADDLSLLTSLVQSHQTASASQKQLQEARAQLQSITAHNYQLQQQASQQQPQPQPQPQTPPAPDYSQAKLMGLWNQVPEYDESWLGLVERDDAGNLVAVSGAMPDIPQKLKARRDWEQKVNNAQFGDPHGLAYESIRFDPQQRVYRDIQSIVDRAVNQSNQRQQTVQSEEVIANLLEDNAGWLFSNDVAGERAGLSEEGKLYERFIQQFQQDGIADPLKQHFYALQAVENSIGRSLTKQPDTTETRNQKRVDILKKQAQRENNRGGSVPKTSSERSPAQNENLNFGEMFEQAMSAKGL